MTWTKLVVDNRKEENEYKRHQTSQLLEENKNIKDNAKVLSLVPKEGNANIFFFIWCHWYCQWESRRTKDQMIITSIK